MKDDRTRTRSLQKRVEDLSRQTPPSLSARASKPRWLKLTLLVVLGLFLIWEVVTRSLVAYLADVSPSAASRLRATEPTALLNLAEATLDRELAAKKDASVNANSGDETGSESGLQAKTPTNSELTGTPSGTPAQNGSIGSADAESQAKSQAQLALFADPLNARAFRILGELAEQSADDRRTELMMQAAVHRSLLESAAVFWLMQRSYRDQNYLDAAGYADTLLRSRPDGMNYVIPILAKIAENPQANGELKQILATNPPWRREFFPSLNKNISDARTPLGILLSLKGTTAPPTGAELRSYLNFLIAHNFSELAYYTWLQFLPAEQLSKSGNLFNGSFEFEPSASPFDWVLPEENQEQDVTIKVATRPDRPGERALFMKFGPGRVNYPDVTQMIMLAPGSYHFKGRYKAEIDRDRALEWRITCGNSTMQIGEGPVVRGLQSEWTDFEFDFTVPETDCSAQYVRLGSNARWESEQFSSGTVWFDDLEILREPSVGL
jgi:hypothetical protein